MGRFSTSSTVKNSTIIESSEAQFSEKYISTLYSPSSNTLNVEDSSPGRRMPFIYHDISPPNVTTSMFVFNIISFPMHCSLPDPIIISSPNSTPKSKLPASKKTAESY